MSRPSIEGSFYTARSRGPGSPRSVLDVHGLAHDAHHHAWGEAAPQEMIAQTRGGALGRRTPQGGETPSRDGACTLELGGRIEIGECFTDERGRDTTSAQIGGEARRAVSARDSRLHVVTGERGVVDVPTVDEIGDDGRGDLRRCAATHESAGELDLREGAPREQVGRDEPRRASIENGGATRSALTNAR